MSRRMLTPMICRSLIAVSILTVGLATPLSAQQDDGLIDDVRSLLDLPPATKKFDYPSLQGCVISLAPDAPEHSDVTMQAAFPPPGGAEMPPARLMAPAPDDADITHLRQFLRIEAQLSACDNLRREAAGRRLTLQTEGNLLRLIEDAVYTPERPSAPRARDEEALGLNRPARSEIQIRLDLAGHDPGRPDGVFGPNTRSAILDWQREQDLPASGYLDKDQLAKLTAQTEEDYVAFRRENQSRNTSSRRRSDGSIYWGRDGCPRYSNGNIVPGYSLKCDLKGTFQLP